MRIGSDITFGQRNNQNIVAPCRVSNFFKNLHQKHYLEYEIFSILKFPCRLFHAYYDSLVRCIHLNYIFQILHITVYCIWQNTIKKKIKNNTIISVVQRSPQLGGVLNLIYIVKDIKVYIWIKFGNYCSGR